MTRREKLNHLLEILASQLGLKVAQSYDDVGGLEIECYNPGTQKLYGLYFVIDERGGVRKISPYLPYGQMITFLEFFIQLERYRNKHED